MIDLEFVERLIKALDESGLDSLELERGGTRVRLSKSPSILPSVGQGAMPVAQVAVPGPSTSNPGPALSPLDASPEAVSVQEEEDGTEGLIEVTSPMVGTFYAAPAPDASPYVEVGDQVGPGTVLCIIEAMKLMNELESEVRGTVARVMVENAQPVEYGQVLFLIDPS